MFLVRSVRARFLAKAAQNWLSLARGTGIILVLNDSEVLVALKWAKSLQSRDARSPTFVVGLGLLWRCLGPISRSWRRPRAKQWPMGFQRRATGAPKGRIPKWIQNLDTVCVSGIASTISDPIYPIYFWDPSFFGVDTFFGSR